MIFSFLYRIALVIYGLAYLPHLIMRAKQEPDRARFFKERLGYFADNLGHLPRVWIHAVSVGEAMALKKFVEDFQVRYPEIQIVLSTTTPTGQKIARSMQNDRVRVVYFPLDFHSMMKRAVDIIKPRMIILMETEIWPHLINLAYKRHIPIGIMNGRISERAFKKYRLIQSWMAPLLAKLSFCLVREEGDRERFLSLGVLPDYLQVTGNMKYDVDAGLDSHSIDKFQKELGFQNNLIMTCGSTHEGEETVLLKVFGRLRKKFPPLKLVLAPRHPERAHDVLKLAKDSGFQAVRFSQAEFSSFDVLIVDLMGQLQSFYAIADLVFVGGSLVPHGGQNPIEAAREKKAVLSGPHVHNFKQVFEHLKKSGGVFLLSNPDELYESILLLLSDPEKRKAMGLRAYEAVQLLKGATQKNLQALELILNRVEKIEVRT